MVAVNIPALRRLYIDETMSATNIARTLGTNYSAERAALLAEGIMRTVKEASVVSRERRSTALRGRTRPEFSPEWRANLSKGRALAWSTKAVGFSLKPNGYLEHTRGEHKSRGAHS